MVVFGGTENAGRRVWNIPSDYKIILSGWNAKGGDEPGGVDIQSTEESDQGMAHLVKDRM